MERFMTAAECETTLLDMLEPGERVHLRMKIDGAEVVFATGRRPRRVSSSSGGFVLCVLDKVEWTRDNEAMLKQLHRADVIDDALPHDHPHRPSLELQRERIEEVSFEIDVGLPVGENLEAIDAGLEFLEYSAGRAAGLAEPLDMVSDAVETIRDRTESTIDAVARRLLRASAAAEHQRRARVRHRVAGAPRRPRERRRRRATTRGTRAGPESDPPPRSGARRCAP
jgi:hypothetical protein